MADKNSDSKNNPEDMSKEEKIGYFKGALATLIKERSELARLLAIVEQIMQSHVQELKELGVDLAGEAKAAKSTGKKSDVIQDDKNLEDLI